jgi:hypothetical protein
VKAGYRIDPVTIEQASVFDRVFMYDILDCEFFFILGLRFIFFRLFDGIGVE